MMYYCRFCGEAPSWNPLTDGECDNCWEKRVQELEAKGLTRSDAQSAIEAENAKWNKEQEAIHQGELEAEIRQRPDKCPDCSGTGNVDQSAGFPLDCATCKGTGWLETEIRLNPFKVGDKVRLPLDTRIFVVHTIYSPTEVSLGLADFPDTEQDYRVQVRDLELVD